MKLIEMGTSHHQIYKFIFALLCRIRSFRRFSTMESLSKLLVLLICYPLVSAQLPLECRSNSSDSSTKGSGICCPLFNNEACGGSRRGQYSDLNTTCNLPSFGNYTSCLLPYFSRMCVCQPAFSGAACDQCAYGFTARMDGKTCARSSKTRIRRDF